MNQYEELFSIAEQIHASSVDDLCDRLQSANRHLLTEPLPAAEVRNIAAAAFRPPDDPLATTITPAMIDTLSQAPMGESALRWLVVEILNATSFEQVMQARDKFVEMFPFETGYNPNLICSACGVPAQLCTCKTRRTDRPRGYLCEGGEHCRHGSDSTHWVGNYELDREIEEREHFHD